MLVYHQDTLPLRGSHASQVHVDQPMPQGAQLFPHVFAVHVCGPALHAAVLCHEPVVVEHHRTEDLHHTEAREATDVAEAVCEEDDVDLSQVSDPTGKVVVVVEVCSLDEAAVCRGPHAVAAADEEAVPCEPALADCKGEGQPPAAAGLISSWALFILIF